MILIKEEVESQELINCSNAVISMAFTSPTFEALASNKPAIFFDPYGLAKNNYFIDIKDLYLRDYAQLKRFIDFISNKSNSIKWVKYVRSELGLENAKLGVMKIQKDISDFFSQKI